MGESLSAFLHALAREEASDDPSDIERDLCRAVGPGGIECCRDRGHEDGFVSGPAFHISYDNDRFEAWSLAGLARPNPEGETGFGTKVVAVIDDLRALLYELRNEDELVRAKEPG